MHGSVPLLAAALALALSGCTAVVVADEKGTDAGSEPAAEGTTSGQKPVAVSAPPPARTAPTAQGATAAEPEEITVEAPSLSGFWKVIGPSFIDVSASPLSGVRIAYDTQISDRNICEIDDRGGSLTGICSAGIEKAATGSRDGSSVALRWWNGPLTMNFDGTLVNRSTLRGRLSGGIAGLSVTGSVPVSLIRLDPEPGAVAEPESGPLLHTALADLAAGHLNPGRYGPDAMSHAEPALARALDFDGTPAVTYLGRVTIRWQRRQAAKVQDVYRVQSGTNQELCRIQLGEKGMVADLDCRWLGS
jgi:hypothetical protein